MSKFTCERCDARYGANELHECGDARADALDDERRAAVAALREVCARHGDNDWPDDLHMADIIEKHLARHLDRKATPTVYLQVEGCCPVEGSVLDAGGRALLGADRARCEPARVGDTADITVVQPGRVFRFLARVSDVHLPGLGVARITVRDVRELVP